MKITFRRKPDLEDEDIAAAWVGCVGDQALALIIFAWSPEFQTAGNAPRFSISYNDQDAALVVLMPDIERIVGAYVLEHDGVDGLEIEFTEVKNETTKTV